MNKQCVQCSKTFRVDETDQAFYQRMDVPAPTLCPDCRQQRRSAWRNERNLYQRRCDLCQREIISMYAADSPYIIYCPDCWWSDRWTALDFGQAYDSSRSFFEQLHELRLRVPRISLFNKGNEDSPYANHCDHTKTTYLSTSTGYSEQIFYSNWIIRCQECSDSYQLEQTQLAYNSLFTVGGYRLINSWYADQGRDLWFTYNCAGSHNCFLSSNQRKQQYVLRNKALSQAEYEAEFAQLNTGSYKQFKHYEAEFKDLLIKTPRRYAEIIQSEDCTGDNIYHSQAVRDSFEVINSTGCRYCYNAGHMQDCYDVYESGFDCQLQYETHASNRTSYSKFCSKVYDATFADYCDDSHDSHYIFGSTGLRQNKYVILNTQYSEESYTQLRQQIIADMQQRGEWGEFFPMQHSPFAYNETMAQVFYPIRAEVAKQHGWRWQLEQSSTQNTSLLATADLPDHIQAATDDLVRTVIACEHCQKPYKIIPQELELYRTLVIPLPRLCPNCRYLERMSQRTGFHLWQRQCMCTQIDHRHQGRCQIEFSTTYSPERKEIVYCDGCYQKEVY